jgi:hypothetical protein
MTALLANVAHAQVLQAASSYQAMSLQRIKNPHARQQQQQQQQNRRKTLTKAGKGGRAGCALHMRMGSKRMDRSRATGGQTERLASRSHTTQQLAASDRQTALQLQLTTPKASFMAMFSFPSSAACPF